VAELVLAVEAIKVDLKSFSGTFYSEYVRGSLEPVLEAIRFIARSKTWLEGVFLIIPGLNDSRDEIRRMSREFFVHFQGKDQGRGYGLDLIGSFLGAAAVSTLLLPLSGLVPTAFFLLGLNMIAAAGRAVLFLTGWGDCD